MVKKVRVNLSSNNIKNLEYQEIKAILRATDELIASGGRNMLAKILKGSKDKKLLEHHFDKCPMYGYYISLTLNEIMHRIDWVIKKGYLEIEYAGRLPVLIYTNKGWEIEKETFAEELFQTLHKALDNNDFRVVKELKDRNREMVLLLIKKIKNSNDKRFIELLNEWWKIEYKKVQKALKLAIDYLNKL